MLRTRLKARARARKFSDVRTRSRDWARPTAAGRFDHVIVTRYATNPRAATVERLVAACRAAGLPSADTAGSPAEALARGRRLAGRNGLVCIAGSFFLAAEMGLG